MFSIEVLKIAGFINFALAAMHAMVTIGGPDWYRFFGAGEEMAKMAEQKRLKPVLVTLAISALLMTWGLYAWSGAGLLPTLPLLKLALIGITSIFLLRGLVGLVAPFVSTHPFVKENSMRFWIWSSLICLAVGAVHLIGLIQSWSRI